MNRADSVPSSLSLSDADRRFTQFAAFRMLRGILEPMQDDYDYCIIDAPPSLGILSLNALVASDRLVIPVNAAAFSIQGIKALVQVVDEVRAENPALAIQGILVTRFNPRTNLGKDVIEVLDEIAKQIGTRVFSTRIRQGVAIEAAQADNKDIFSAAPRSGVARDYEAFVEEFVKE